MCSISCREIGECFNALDEDSDCRAIILSGSGKLFTAGNEKHAKPTAKLTNVPTGNIIL